MLEELTALHGPEGRGFDHPCPQGQTMTDSALHRQIRIAGYLHICLGTVILILATIRLVETYPLERFHPIVLNKLFWMFIAFGLFDLGVGIGIVTRTRWAWFVLWVVSLMILPVFPIGTGIAIYSCRVLLQTREM